MGCLAIPIRGFYLYSTIVSIIRFKSSFFLFWFFHVSILLFFFYLCDLIFTPHPTILYHRNYVFVFQFRIYMISIDPDFSGGGIISIGSNCSKIGFFESTIPIAFFFGSSESARSHGEATTKRRSSTALQITSASKYNLNSPYI